MKATLQTVKKIVVNFLQVTSLAAGLPLRWPRVRNDLRDIQNRVLGRIESLDSRLRAVHMKTADVLSQAGDLCVCGPSDWMLVRGRMGVVRMQRLFERRKPIKKGDAKDYAICRPC